MYSFPVTTEQKGLCKCFLKLLKPYLRVDWKPYRLWEKQSPRQSKSSLTTVLTTSVEVTLGLILDRSGLKLPLRHLGCTKVRDYWSRWRLTFLAWSTEGGIRCPSIVAFPKLGKAVQGTIKHDLTTVMDILPTVVCPDLYRRRSLR